MRRESECESGDSPRGNGACCRALPEVSGTLHTTRVDAACLLCGVCVLSDLTCPCRVVCCTLPVACCPDFRCPDAFFKLSLSYARTDSECDGRVEQRRVDLRADRCRRLRARPDYRPIIKRCSPHGPINSIAKRILVATGPAVRRQMQPRPEKGTIGRGTGTSTIAAVAARPHTDRIRCR